MIEIEELLSKATGIVRSNEAHVSGNGFGQRFRSNGFEATAGNSPRRCTTTLLYNQTDQQRVTIERRDSDRTTIHGSSLASQARARHSEHGALKAPSICPKSPAFRHAVAAGNVAGKAPRTITSLACSGRRGLRRWRDGSSFGAQRETNGVRTRRAENSARNARHEPEVTTIEWMSTSLTSRSPASPCCNVLAHIGPVQLCRGRWNTVRVFEPPQRGEVRSIGGARSLSGRCQPIGTGGVMLGSRLSERRL